MTQKSNLTKRHSTAETKKRRVAFEKAIQSLMCAPKVYGSFPSIPDPGIKLIDSAINLVQSAADIDMLRLMRAKLVAEDEAKEAKKQASERVQLHPDEIDAIVNIALDLLGGHDPRELLGIKGKPGPRPDPNLLQYEYDVATYFWALRMRNRKMLAKTAAAKVSRACGISEPRVMKIARRHGDFVKGFIQANPHMNFLGTSMASLQFNGATFAADGESTPIVAQ